MSELYDWLLFLFPICFFGLNSQVRVSLAIRPKVSQQCSGPQPLRSLLPLPLRPRFVNVGLRHFQSCACLVAQLCPTLCDPMDCSPPDSSVHGILQAKILMWVAISFSTSWGTRSHMLSCSATKDPTYCTEDERYCVPQLRP